MAGYSGTPLFQKLGLKPGMQVQFVNEPNGFPDLLGAESATLGAAESDLHVAVLFLTERRELETMFPLMTGRMRPDGAIWIGWPKKASKVPTDITEDVLREVCLPTGWVDNKVCAIDEKWSGLRFVLRRELRGSAKVNSE